MEGATRMFSKILEALTLVRTAAAITVITGAAGAMVAGTVDTSTQTVTSSAQSARTVAVDTTSASEQADVTVMSEREQTREQQRGDGRKTERPDVAAVKNETAKVERPVRATDKPTTPKVNTEALSSLVRECLAKYAIVKTSNEGASAASEACRTAIAASGLSSTDFWARFAPKADPTTPVPTTRPAYTRKPEATPTAESTR